MATNDAELAAIQALIAALEPLDTEARGRVVSYALSRFDIRTGGIASVPASAAAQLPGSTSPAGATDIRSLKETKAPRSGNEMAALVAFYLSELAPEDERKDFITTADIKRYFKQASFPLPKEPRYTLVNAKNAGYFDATNEAGSYRLNPVGYNLVAHALPAAGTKTAPKPKPKRRTTRG